MAGDDLVFGIAQHGRTSGADLQGGEQGEQLNQPIGPHQLLAGENLGKYPVFGWSIHGGADSHHQVTQALPDRIAPGRKGAEQRAQQLEGVPARQPGGRL